MYIRGRDKKADISAFMVRIALAMSFLLFTSALSAGTSASAESLSAALKRALATNPTINAEREKLRGVEESLGIAEAGYRPSITVNGDVTRQNLYTDYGPGGTSPISTGATDDTYTPRGYSLNINQPLYRGGRTVAAVSEADANIRASRQNLRNVVQNTLLDVATTYINVVRNEAIRRLRRNNLRLLTEQKKATVGRWKAGVVTATDVALAESRVSAARSALSLADANLRTSRADYVRLTGRSPVSLFYPRIRGKLPARNMAEAIDRAKNENPAILAARYARDAAKFAIAKARGQRLPEITLEAGFDQHWDTTKNIEEQRTANIRLRARVPFYQGGAVIGRIRQAQALLRQRGLEISAATARVRAQVVSSWESMMAAKSRIRSAGEQIKAAEKALTGIRSEESVGQRTVLDVLDAEQELLNARVVSQQARGDYITAYFRLLNALGRFGRGRGIY